MKRLRSTIDVFAEGASSNSGGCISFRRHGDGFVLDNGVLKLRGELCGERLLQSIRLGEQECGCLDVVLKLTTPSGGSQWPAIRSLCGVSFRKAGTTGILDLVGDWWEFKPPWTITGAALRAHVRLTVRPGEPFFLVEFAGLENSGTQAIRLERFCFNALPSPKTSPVVGLKSSEAENSSAWDVGNGILFGLRSEDEVIGRFSFWVDEKSQCPHGDCGFDFKGVAELLPGQRVSQPISSGAMVFVRKRVS